MSKGRGGSGRVQPVGRVMPGSARHLGPAGLRALQQQVDSMKSPNHRRGKK